MRPSTFLIKNQKRVTAYAKNFNTFMKIAKPSNLITSTFLKITENRVTPNGHIHIDKLTLSS